jgi:RNA polymerase sigma-70 factor (ECF subfamily)
MSTGEPSDDGVLVKRLRGNEAQKHQLFDELRPALVRLAERICRGDGAEDAVQSALLNAAEHLHDFRGSTDAELWGWLRTIVRNQCLLEHRNDRRKSALPAATGIDLAGAVADSAGTPSQAARRSEEQVRLICLLGELTPEQLEAISYRYFEGWSISQISQQMGKSQQAVMGLLHRGLDRLRDQTSPSEWSQTLK